MPDIIKGYNKDLLNSMIEDLENLEKGKDTFYPLDVIIKIFKETVNQL